jgi:ribosomal-protein-alanine N-acetyltransferase
MTKLFDEIPRLENRASARVLEKNGFIQVSHAVDEDWGFPEPTPADKWIR